MLNDDTVQLVLGFGAKQLLAGDNMYLKLRGQYPNADIVLCSTSGEIFEDKVTDNSVSVTAIEFNNTTVETASVNIGDFNNDGFAAGASLVRRLQTTNQLCYIMILSDGGKVNGSELVNGINSCVQNNIPVTGGLAGESRFRQAFEKIGDNVWEHDFATGETYFSNTKSHLLGYDLNEFADNVNLSWKNAYDDDRHLLEENDAKYKRGAIEHHILEYRIRHKDGSVRWVMDRGVVIESTPEGLPLKIIGTHTDITERKNAEVLLQREEQKYRSIIANMNLGLMEVDLDEKVIFVNQSFCDMSEYSTDEIDGFFVKSLFDKFSQEDVSVTRQYGGTGLGMSICKDLVELMGGEISVESTKGVGTRVSFIIEFAKGTLNALPAKDTFNFSKEMLAAKTILVVDDNKMNRLVAKAILGNYGAVVIEAVNGSEAIDLLAQPGIDVVLMDIQMPVMGGMEATEIIRKTISQTLPIIALTANAIKGDNEKYLKGGMNAYLSKPFKEFDLLNIVALSISKK